MIATLEAIKLELLIRQLQSGELIWKMKDGTIKPVRDLSTSHLKNIIENSEKRLSKQQEIKPVSLNFY